jgi:hypothetical protein
MVVGWDYVPLWIGQPSKIGTITRPDVVLFIKPLIFEGYPRRLSLCHNIAACFFPKMLSPIAASGICMPVTGLMWQCRVREAAAPGDFPFCVDVLSPYVTSRLSLRTSV